jgi:His/Glu/Gln/Arg/opine family amino acid ABC transporter permease subunit
MMNLSSAQLYGYLGQLLAGAVISLKLFVASFALALAAGILVGIATLSRHWLVRALWRVYASIFMGVPSLLVIFLTFYGGSAMLSGLHLASRGIDITPFGAGLVALGVVYTAYVAELVHGAVGNLPRGQFEAVRALAIRPLPAWRHVILPQVLRLALPGLVNVWMVMLKETPLVSLAGLNDLVANAKIAAGATKEPFIFFIAAALFFVVFSAVTLRLNGVLEARLGRGHAKVKA